MYSYFRKEEVNKKNKKHSSKEEYEVEKILNKRIINSKVEYYIKWKDYTKEHNSWEPLENINCKKLINLFEKFQNKNLPKRGRKRKLCDSTVNSSSSTFGPSEQSCNNSSLSVNKNAENTARYDMPDLTGNNDNVGTTPVEKIAEKIIWATRSSGQLKLLVKWEGIEEPELMLAKDINILFPQVVIKFYAARLTW